MADDADRRSQEIGNAVDTLETQIREQIARTRSGTTAILVIGLILIVIVFAVLTKLVSEIKKEMKPETLVETAHAFVSPMIHGGIEKLEEGLDVNPQEQIAQLKNHIIETIPEYRKVADREFADMIDGLADELDAKIDQAVGETLDQLKPTVGPLIEASKEKGEWQELEKAFKDGLQTVIGAKADEVVLKFDRKMSELDMHLNRLLKDEKDMTDHEKFQKNIVTAMLVFMCDVLETVVKEQAVRPR